MCVSHSRPRPKHESLCTHNLFEKSEKYRWCQGCVVFSPETDATLVLKNLNVGFTKRTRKSHPLAPRTPLKPI